MRKPCYLALSLLASLLPVSVHAAPEEIQVYMDELNPRGEPGLDLHINDVASGHRWRVTPEWSLGLGGGFEAGLYLPLATLAPDGKPRLDGVKARMKWLAPHGEQGFYWGINDEIGWSDHRIDDHHWNNEIKLIGGWRRGRWLAATNLNLDGALSGPNPGPITSELDEKLGFRVSKQVTLGVETYNSLGRLRALGDFSHYDQASFLVLDAHLGRWDVNAGVGKGYGGNADRLIIKCILSIPLTYFYFIAICRIAYPCYNIQ